MSRFSCVESAPPVAIFALSKAYREDPHPKKVDLGIGAYRTNEAKPWVLPVVRKAEDAIFKDENLNHEYLGQLGMESFTQLATKMLLGEDSPALKEQRAFGVQSLSGTGALRIGSEFLKKCAGFQTVYVSKPSWPNHHLVLKNAGFTDVRTYRYWDGKNRSLDFDGMLEDLIQAPEDSVVILHVCAHNPTGVDPTVEQWNEIANVIEKKRLFTFFDCAYQGFASGDLVKDSYSVRYFVSRGFEFLCAQSFAKNFGLYCQRIGNLTFVAKNADVLTNVKAQMALIVRGNYSNPPAHGARIVSHVLGDSQLNQEWHDCIKLMSGRIIQMRKALRDKLEELKTPGDWSHITSQIGMFTYTGLTPNQVRHLIDDYHIYLPNDGRISICGLNTNNVEYVAQAFNDVVIKYPENN
ncbi:Golgi Transport [Dermatophagoides pteronyssinus]|uniref:aspartate transaminase n=1 Tax=Dermatophagoides pteronyssinus TaxID=6956 RepID=A0ABQ8J7E1_DERPT|nr:Golgi Transport [Dermatophagoides pteronyssinus]